MPTPRVSRPTAPARPAARPAAKTTAHRPSATVTAYATARKEVTTDDMRSPEVPGELLSTGPVSTVEVAVGQTINLGQFSTMRIDARVTLPCVPGEEEGAYDRASDLAATFFNQEKAKWNLDT